MVESEKNRRLMEEMNTSHKRIQSLESELSESKVNSGRPYDDINNLTRDSEKMIREIETLKRRCVGFQIQHNIQELYPGEDKRRLCTLSNPIELKICLNIYVGL